MEQKHVPCSIQRVGVDLFVEDGHWMGLAIGAEVERFNGLCVNEDAQVLDLADNPIEGLYACGDTAAALTGSAYPGAGGTIGAGFYRGIRAANHALGLGMYPMGQ